MRRSGWPWWRSSSCPAGKPPDGILPRYRPRPRPPTRLGHGGAPGGGDRRPPGSPPATTCVAHAPGRGHFGGQPLHTARYRRPRDFAGRRVIVAGGGTPGAGIAADLGTTPNWPGPPSTRPASSPTASTAAR
ncbi:hypothetical protein ACWCPI_30100 [Streptomyces sp. NPDC001920]